MDALLADPTGDLTTILTQHVVPGESLVAEDLIAAGTVPNVAEGELTITAEGDTVTVDAGGGPATVVCANVPVANGTVHLIDTVLLPARLTRDRRGRAFGLRPLRLRPPVRRNPVDRRMTARDPFGGPSPLRVRAPIRSGSALRTLDMAVLAAPVAIPGVLARPIVRRSRVRAPLTRVGLASWSSLDEELLAGLMAQVADGDQTAFAQVYDRLAPAVFGVARRVLRDPAQAEEVAQEVFVEMWRQASRFDGTRGSVRTWAVTISHRRAVDRVRSEQAHRTRHVRTGAVIGLAEPTPEDTAVEREERRRAVGALDSLTDVQREALGAGVLRRADPRADRRSPGGGAGHGEDEDPGRPDPPAGRDGEQP